MPQVVDRKHSKIFLSPPPLYELVLSYEHV